MGTESDKNQVVVHIEDDPAAGSGGALQLRWDKLVGSSVAEQINNALLNNRVVVFGKNGCPFTLELQRLFGQAGASYALLYVDAATNRAEVHEYLKRTYAQKTLPYVFINQEFIGGCAATKELLRAGKLEQKLGKAGIKPSAPLSLGALAASGLLDGVPRAPGARFMHPDVVDERAARWTAAWDFIICLLVAVFYDSNCAHWVMVGLMGDIALRYLGGYNVSPLGSLSNIVTTIMDTWGGSAPNLVSGPQKQFATACHLFVSALSVLFYLLQGYDNNLQIVGLAFTCLLGLLTLVHSVSGVCLGSALFTGCIQAGFVPRDINLVYSVVKAEMEAAGAAAAAPAPAAPPQVQRKHLDETRPSQLDLKYKAKASRSEHNLVKHVKMVHFFMHVGIIGLACPWKAASSWEALWAPRPVYMALALGALPFFVLWVALYILKCVYYPQKVMKEWQCNVRSNAFGVPWVILVLYAFLVQEQSRKLAIILFWIGAPVNLALSIIKVADWVCFRKTLGHINAAWIVIPVSNFVAALIGPGIDPAWRDAMQFFFGFAFMMWVPLAAITFYKAVVGHEDDGARVLLAVWVACPSLMAIAYTSVYGGPGSLDGNGVFNDFIFINMHWFSVSIALIYMWCCFRGYFGRLSFNLGYWGAGFPADCLALVCIVYYVLKSGPLSHAIAIAALAAASVINAVLLLQTLAVALKGQVFVPDPKGGPLGLVDLTHAAVRGALARLVRQAQAVAGGDAGPESLSSLQAQWRLLQLALDEHTQHEEKVVHRLYDDMFPGITYPFSRDHEDHWSSGGVVGEMVAKVCSGPTPASASALVSALTAYQEEMVRHMGEEEAHLQALPRKYVPGEVATAVVQACWKLTPADKWYHLLPWVINNLSDLGSRVAFVKIVLLGAGPERAQDVGRMLGTGVDAVQWKRITDELPEIIPRGAPHWQRYH